MQLNVQDYRHKLQESSSKSHKESLQSSPTIKTAYSCRKKSKSSHEPVHDLAVPYPPCEESIIIITPHTFHEEGFLSANPKIIKAMASSEVPLSDCSSHSSLSGRSGERGDSEDDEKMKLLVHQENRNVMKMKIVVVGSLFLCAMVLGVITFQIASGEEEDDFRDEVSGGSNKATFQLKSQN
jgi:hypothetical protein